MSAGMRLEEQGMSDLSGTGLGEIDEPAFSALAERHRRELHVHCYRMLGSFEDAEDTVQETLLRAWRRRETFEGRSTFRAWLYRIATNACLDQLAKCRPEPATGGEVRWLQPYPDRLLDELPAGQADDPETAAAPSVADDITQLPSTMQGASATGASAVGPSYREKSTGRTGPRWAGPSRPHKHARASAGRAAFPPSRDAKVLGTPGFIPYP